MRYMIMHKNDPHTEAGELPPPTLIAEMNQFIGEFMGTGRFLDGAGLRGSQARTRLTFRDGHCTVKHGPYKGETELPLATMKLTVATREEAIGWAERYGKILGDGEIEIGAMTEPWDLGMMPKPENPPLHLLMIEKATAASEAGQPKTAKQKADLTRLRTEMTKAGVLEGNPIHLTPSSQAKRLVFTNNALRVIDGPFSESKELIGGFTVMEMTDIPETIEMCVRYAKILGGTLEIDVRPLADSE